MPGYTRNKLIPFSLPGEAPDDPAQSRDRAEAIDAAMVAQDAEIAALEAQLVPAEASVILLGDQSTTSSASTRLQFNTTEYDDSSMWNGTLFQMEITGATAGTYNITAQVCWATNASGHRAFNLMVSGARKAAPLMLPASSLATRVGISRNFRLVAGDTVYVESYQSSGGALNTTGSTTNNTFLSLARLHP
ncbi:hypothetical protein [Glycomyces paridis]|uniref:C1q domain-containing protein n=1 Tax=Glycomyces paridis TaxID=2126555 RepID=A0A4S8P8V0_9ACTN|nr:hypothetical protein [Glycomyces paridis]THV26015.1 hypothetical protein E9998_19990 [Glycomyces paridis]